MTGGGPSKPKLPPVAAPIPTPEEIDIEATAKGEAERRRIRGRKGLQSTILTETDNLGTTTRAKSPILGTVGA